MPKVAKSSLVVGRTEHEACPDCGKTPAGAFYSHGQWFAKCPELGCHNTTGPCESAEMALAVWDAWARQVRIQEMYGERLRGEREAVAG